MTDATHIPAYADLLWSTLCAVRELGHSARLDEIDERVIERENFSEEQVAVLHGRGPGSELEYRLAWARTYLKGMGLLASASRGVWETTSLGRDLPEEAIEPLLRKYKEARRRARRRKQVENDAEGTSSDENGESVETNDWKEHLLECMLAMSPAGFERLAERLLRAAGFINTTVTGRSGDGGIDGVGVYRLSLVSFPVFFQCKRYKGSVEAKRCATSVVRWPGRGDKGLLITTGTFTREARSEATRDGAPPIDLIDGERLCELLKEARAGGTHNRTDRGRH